MMRSLRNLARKNPLLHGAARKLSQLWRLGTERAYYATHGENIDEVFRARYQLPYSPTHYYSPLPDIALVKQNLARWYKESETPGIDWNIEQQLKLIEELAKFAGEANSLPSFAQIMQDGYGPGYGEIEAHLLYMILRLLKPSKCIEVGSGVSTFYSLRALHANLEEDGVSSAMTCIEPYPSNQLRELLSEYSVRLEVSEVQDVKFELFRTLAANDVLFIDTSHVSKKDSDVDYLYLEVLPRLKPGVVIHIHDMPFPMPTPPPEHPVFDTFLFWNEPSLVRAFLAFNTAFQVMLCQSYLHHTKPEVLKKLVPIYDPQVHFPSSLWLRKVI